MTDPKMRWYEPQHSLLGSKTYFAHTWGSLYVLSGDTAAFLARIPPERLRYFSNEGAVRPPALQSHEHQHCPGSMNVSTALCSCV